MKCKIFLFFVLVLVLSCGETKKEMPPKYNFETGKELSYNLKGKADLNVDMGLFVYNSGITFSTKANFLPTETNQYGYHMQMTIKDLTLEGVSNQLQTALFMGVNSIRKLLSEFDIDEYGNTRVIVNGTQIDYLSYILEVFFVNLKDIQNKKSFSTNISGWIDKNTPIVSKYESQSFIKEKRGNIIIIYQGGNLTTYGKEEFEKSVEPKSIGIARYELNNRFDVANGKLLDKNATFDINYEIPVKQGFITTFIKIKCKGELKLSSSEVEI
ncbi:MAG: hypothetical protein N2258_08980 [Brevinematales bacterium]|nr:hypothetical protein [Brevinematales bacterium]